MRNFRFLRPYWLDENYIIGNSHNGFIGNSEMLEQWEEEIPCSHCHNDDCRKPCGMYDEWLRQVPLRRIRGESNEIFI